MSARAALETRSADWSELTFDLALDPVSLGTEAEATAAFARVLAPELSRVPFLITTPVALAVACAAVPSPWDPQAVEYPNLRMWLRPLVDTLSGTDRLLVSPSMVSSLRITTRSRDEDLDTLALTLSYRSDRMLGKRPLRVVTS